MKIVLPEPSVNLYNEGFEEPDILQRRKAGDALSDLLNRIDDPLVVALDGRWGTGKTYFLKRWVTEHKGATTIYFDAFAHDYFGDPLPALISALAERTNNCDRVPLDAVRKAAAKLAGPLARAGLAALTWGATELLAGLGDAVAGSIVSDADAAIQKLWTLKEGRRAAMAEFRKAIEDLAHPADDGHRGATVIFVIDELDRCRPVYTLEVLELIKHLFSVPHLHFVLGVNLEALESMVRARFGPEIDAHRYLGKFIQVRLELPDKVNDGSGKKTMLAYLEHLVDRMGIQQHISGPLRKEVEFVARANHVSLRDIGSIVSSVSLANGAVVRNPEKLKFYPGWIDVMNTLIISKTVRPDLYPKFLNTTVTPEELRSWLGTNEREVRPKLGPNFNHDHNTEVSIRYYCWLYLSQNEEFNECDPELTKCVRAQFQDHGSLADPRALPIKVQRQWLDRFSFYAPNQP